MKRTFVAILLGVALLFTGPTQTAEASPVGYRVGVVAQWGWIPWYGVWNPYGYSYWGYYHYHPRYSSFGAISYDLQTDAVGYAWGTGSRASAQASANAFCGASCRSVLWVRGGCGAISLHTETETNEQGEVVSTKATGLTWGLHPNKRGAISRAQRACRRQGTGICKTRAWVCSY